MVFETGYDFFDDLQPYGLNSDEEARRAARKAWARLGRHYLQMRQPDPREPWALKRFGEP